MLEDANEISFTFDEDDLDRTDASSSEPSSSFDPENHEQALERAASRNRQGSFERLMQGGLG